MMVRIMAVFLAVGLGLAYCVTPSFPATGSSVSVQVWGGSYESSLRQYVIASFEQKYNATVNVILGDAPFARLKAEGVHPSVDFLHMGEEEGYEAQHTGLLSNLDMNNIPNAKNLYREARISAQQIATNWGTWGLIYRTDQIKTPPTSWMDMWNPAYRGRVMIWDATYESTDDLLMIVAQSVGVKDFPSEAGMGPVERKLAELKPNIFGFAKSQTEIKAALDRGDVWLAVTSNGRAIQWKQAGAPVGFVIPKEGGIALTTVVGVTANSPNKALAEKFLNEEISDAAEKAFAEVNFFGPSVKNVTIPADIASLMPSTPAQVSKLRHLDFPKVIPWRDRLVELFNRALK